jgi:Protein of unknown function (DUF3311)
MAQSSTPSKSPARLGTVAVLLTATVAGALWVPLYAHVKPKLGAFPFFYWYQLALVPVVAAACWISYLLLRPEPSPDGDTGDEGWRR